MRRFEADERGRSADEIRLFLLFYSIVCILPSCAIVSVGPWCVAAPSIATVSVGPWLLTEVPINILCNYVCNHVGSRSP